ncbi:MAG: TetR family transcriptional regulator [Cryobacterium sp.]|jgi:AcrR family transcriptional regulator|nr:TetR family transcriptional regulator [Cryobacterium sp.]
MIGRAVRETEFTVSGPTTLLRNEPVQARSNARLTSLLDAAAAAIDAVGYERLTTAMVAERAGASIGTVYRYFPDRIAVLQSVASRAVDRFTERIDNSLDAASHPTWWSAIDSLIDLGVSAFRNEPAFAAIRFGDVLDLRPRESQQTGSSRVAAHVAPVLVSRFGLAAGDALAFHLEVAFTIVDSLLARAFAFNANGDQAYIDQARTLARTYLVSVFGEPRAR